MSEDEFERFVAKVPLPNIEGGCMEWKGYKNRDGYGQFNVAGKMKKAHRLSFEHYIGPIPEGLCVLHKCDTPGCVRPDHLSVGTHHQNMADKMKKNRHADTRGELHGRAKLTEANVRTIKAKYLDGMKKTEIAIEMGVNQTQIGRILRGEQWKHVI